ncbi:hypothetical protein FA95DRAFT_1581710 [Auriscalpium vulgare]|uniref:Uncharacterized protein n=1 Tax=Auriscalpium vulgare TaxID=40419 RepID=A0ACB8S043_9AGAM|nr:hypothetical protein FA95DRAFT_1581710 [Auriscalpium vulgare]
MTRTERSTSPRALLKDRSEARNGYDNSLRKGGAGAHNWGSLEDEARYENEGLADEEADFVNDPETAGAPKPDSGDRTKPQPIRRTSSVTEEDRNKAVKVRQNALKDGGIDLAAIARSSVAVSSSPPKVVPITTDASTATLSE